MDVPSRTQIAVVGASPGGLAAAERAAREGAEVHLLEAGRVGEPEPPAVVGFDRVWPDGIRPPDDALRSRFREVRLSSPAGHAVTVEAPGRVVHRTRLDRWLADRARKAGARVHDGTGPWRVEGHGRLSQADRSLEADVVVFADGAHSIAREIVDPVQAPDALVWGVTHEVDVPGPREGVDVRVGDHAPGGRTQLLPLDGTVSWHWTFARRPRAEAIGLAERALEAEARRRGWPDRVLEDARRRHVAPDPVFQRPGRLAADRTLVTGGAAGLGGLEVGLTAGSLAGRAAARAVADGGVHREALLGYERTCHERFAPAYRGLANLIELAERVPDGVLDALARPWAGRRLDLDGIAGLAVDDARARASALAGLLRDAPVPATRSIVGGLWATGASLS